MVTADVKWEQLLRFRLIEIVALWEGRLTTNHLCNSFNIGRQQASRDIANYQKLFEIPPLVHDRGIKGYRPTNDFKPRFTQGTPNEYLSLLNKYTNENIDGFDLQGLGQANSIVLSVPDRHVAPIIVRRLLQAAREQRCVDVDYVSLEHPSERGRNIAPHTLVFDGFRWHVRAYCEEKKGFRDFVLSRFRNEPEILDKSSLTKEDDDDWNIEETFEITTNPFLTQEQQLVVKADYGMLEAQFFVSCRRALIKYYVKRLNICLDTKKLKSSPQANQLTVAQPHSLKRWIL
ncbi:MULTISPECIES: helix-turn-helix transcriptional regulator [Shewanella]|uniref:helix-turn-helix transcriptional regulator n=1 Tax=Shewanella TaxID=22 RepID=UPI00059D57D5|nr:MULTISPECIES: WYL domain-containing protein [Shewanella]MDH0448696.1 WYL domain-containing protein [Shewanella sp. GD04112]QYJ90825.1 WYL domain-containing protein [Shewanella halotolerans]